MAHCSIGGDVTYSICNFLASFTVASNHTCIQVPGANSLRGIPYPVQYQLLHRGRRDGKVLLDHLQLRELDAVTIDPHFRNISSPCTMRFVGIMSTSVVIFVIISTTASSTTASSARKLR
eukprot:1970425-Amphidinium_carterae.1